MKPVVANGVRIPLSYLKEAGMSLDDVRKQCTVQAYNVGEGQAYAVDNYQYRRRRQVAVLPRAYGLSLCKKLKITPKASVSFGDPLSLNLKSISLWDYQKPWVEEIVSKFRKRMDILARAATGKGKTVMSLEIARRLGQKTLIIVDQEFIRDQWINKGICNPMFLNADPDQVGLVQGKTVDWEGKDFVIAMIQTLYRKSLPKEFYKAFGTVIVDEAHIAGAPVFSKVLFQFRPRYRLLVSATTDRGDELQKVIEQHVGKVAVKLDSEHQGSKVRILETDRTFSWYANTSPKTGRYLSEVSADGERNLLICQAVERLYESGRDVLAVSDRIPQLEAIAALLRYRGNVPEEEIGICARKIGVYAYAKDPNPPRMPVGYSPKDKVEFTPVSVQRIEKRVSSDALNRVKETCRVILATYGMFEKAVDVPRLSAGIDCTPRSKAQQLHGRILRPQEGKLTPIWVTIRDKYSKRAEYQLQKRISDYIASNASLEIWNLEKGVKRVDPCEFRNHVKGRVADLKSRRIITRRDGMSTIAM